MTADRQAPSTSSTVLPPAAPSNGTGISPASLSPQHSSGQQLNRAEIWVRRIWVLLFVVSCAVVGVLLVVLPWSLQWTANRFLWSYPDLRAALSNGFVRGIFSGLGVINLWIGFREAVYYAEARGPAK